MSDVHPSPCPCSKAGPSAALSACWEATLSMGSLSRLCHFWASIGAAFLCRSSGKSSPACLRWVSASLCLSAPLCMFLPEKLPQRKVSLSSPSAAQPENCGQGLPNRQLPSLQPTTTCRLHSNPSKTFLPSVTNIWTPCVQMHRHTCLCFFFQPKRRVTSILAGTEIGCHLHFSFQDVSLNITLSSLL